MSFFDPPLLFGRFLIGQRGLTVEVISPPVAVAHARQQISRYG